MKYVIPIITCVCLLVAALLWENHVHGDKVFPLDHSTSVKVMKLSELPADFFDPDHPTVPLQRVHGKDGHDYLLMRMKLKQVTIMHITYPGSRSNITLVTGRKDTSSEAPEGSIFVHDLTVLSAETGADCSKMAVQLPDEKE